ncbi:MAG: PDZ domain-containing protein, partial [Saprospiraceae bacterium]
PGKSGGALVDVDGKLIGINSAIATPNGVFAGYSFAIPVNLVKRIVDDLISYGEYKRAYLGVDIATMNGSVAQQLGIDYSKGVVITGLDPTGSAAAAGAKELDIITAINGKSVTTSAELLELIGRSKVGETADLKVLRSGKEREFQVPLRTRGKE